MQEVLDKYGITFSIAQYGENKLKVLLSDNEAIEYLGQFCILQKDPIKLNTQINYVTQVLNTEIPPFYWNTYDQRVHVGENFTEFRLMDHDSTTGYGEVGLTLPTQDFKDILIEWEKFLAKPIE